SSNTQKRENTPSTCSNCGISHGSGCCPAASKECSYCHRNGHFANLCRKRLRECKSSYNSGRASAIIAGTDLDFDVIAVPVTIRSSTKQTHSSRAIGNCKTIWAIPDTGADVTIITKDDAAKLDISPQPSSKKIRSAGGDPIHILGSANVTIARGQLQCNAEIFVGGCDRNYMSISVCKSLRFVPEEFPSVIASATSKTENKCALTSALIREFVDVFGNDSELTPMKGNKTIQLNDSPPQHSNPTFRSLARPPPVLDSEADIRDFDDWTSLYSIFSKIAGLCEQSRDQQLSTLWTFFSPEMLGIVRDVLDIPEDTGHSVDHILMIIRRHLRARRSVNVDWHDLLSSRQLAGEKITSFVARLKRQSRYVGEISPDSLVKACLIRGLRDDQLRSKVLSTSPARDLNETIEFLQGLESAESDANTLQGNINASIAGLKDQKPNNKRNPKHSKPWQTQNRSSNTQKRENTPSTCSNCGISHGSGCCPAASKECSYCHRNGHFANLCRKRLRECKSSYNSGRASAIIAGTDLDFDVIAVPVTIRSSTKQTHSSRAIGNCKTIWAIPDTGADVTIITKDDAAKLDISPQPSSKKIRSAGGDPIHILGSANVTIARGQLQCNAEIFVGGCDRNYLSISICKSLRFVPEEFPSVIASATSKTENKCALTSALIREFVDVFGNDSELTPMKGN
ncbi:hypothetical protein TCAL_11873, partial [Tigriopus californicus]